jgi:hypothetical protein
MPDLYNMHGGRDSYPCWAVRIDRRTQWGNPFKVGRDGTRDEVVAKFEVWLDEMGWPKLRKHWKRTKILVPRSPPSLERR